MIGHKNILMQFDMREPFGQCKPDGLRNLPRLLQIHLIIQNRTKGHAMLLYTNGDKIKSWLTIIISRQAFSHKNSPLI